MKLIFSLLSATLFSLSISAQSKPDSTDRPAAPPPLVQPASQPQPPPQPEPPSQPEKTSPPYFYYCEKAKAYYPTITKCEEGWVAVPAAAASPTVRWPEPRPPATEETVKSQPNVVSVELFGKTFLYSLDYDRSICPHLALGVGIASWQANTWLDYHATVTVVPIYANYYFSQQPLRGFLTAGVDWISVTQAWDNDNIFANNGFAGVIGGGYEIRDNSGFLLRFGGLIIAGRSIIFNPEVNVGFAF